MSATEPRPLRADARRNRERIMDAAREVFAESGQAAQMDDVARRACVGVGTVYRHFPTKAALVGEIMATKFRNHLETARRWTEADDLTGWDAFAGFLRESWAAMAADAAQQRMMWMIDDAAIQYAEPARAELSLAVGTLIDRAHAEGTLRPDFGVENIPALMCAVGSVMGAQIEHVQGWETLTDVLLAGLRAPAAAA